MCKHSNSMKQLVLQYAVAVCHHHGMPICIYTHIIYAYINDVTLYILYIYTHIIYAHLKEGILLQSNNKYVIMCITVYIVYTLCICICIYRYTHIIVYVFCAMYLYDMNTTTYKCLHNHSYTLRSVHTHIRYTNTIYICIEGEIRMYFSRNIWFCRLSAANCVYTCMYLYIYMYVYICICIHVYVYIYTHVYI